MRVPWTMSERDNLRFLRLHGLSVSQCARVLHRPLGSVAQCLHRMGLCKPINHARRRPGELIHAVRSLRGKGRTVAEISDGLGINRSVVYETFTRAGIK